MARFAELVLAACFVAGAAEPGYINPAVCRSCHQAIFDSYAQTGMARSLAPVKHVPNLTELYHRPSERYYSIVFREDRPFLRRTQEGNTNVVEKSIDFVIGSG